MRTLREVWEYFRDTLAPAILDVPGQLQLRFDFEGNGRIEFTRYSKGDAYQLVVSAKREGATYAETMEVAGSSMEKLAFNTEKEIARLDARYRSMIALADELERSQIR